MASREVGQLRTKLSWEDDGANRTLTRFKEDLRGLNTEMKVAQSRGKEYTSSMRGMQGQQDILTRKFKTQQEQVRELSRRYEEARKAKGEDDKQTRNLARAYNRAQAAMNDTEQELKQLTRAIEDQRNPWKRLSEDATAAGDKLQSIGRGLSSFGREYTMKVTAPIVAGGTAAFKAAMDWESAFAGVRKTVDASEEDFAKLERGIRDMALELPTAATDIAAVAESAGQLGIEKDSILDFTRTIIDLGEATNLTREQAATEFARFANIMQMSQKDFDRLGSSVVSLGNNMATTESEIVSMAMRLAAQGQQVGMTEAEVMGLAAAMSSVGIEAEAGGTAMTTVLKKIQTAVADNGTELEGWAKVAGVSTKDFKAAFEDNAVGALDLVIKGLAKGAEEGDNMAGTLADLGVKGVREADTMMRLAGATDLLSEAVGISSEAWKENSALSDEAAQRYATTESQLKILWNRMKEIAITVGQALIPAVMGALDAMDPWVEKIEDAAESFSEMDEEQQRNILKMIALAAAIGPASVAFGGLTTTLGGALKVFGGLAGILGKAGGGGLLGRFGLMGLTGGPVGLAIAGVGGLIAVMELLSDESDRSVEATLNHIETRKAEIDQLDQNIARFGELQEKNKLTTDEVLRYMDVMDELKEARTEEGIKKLSDEQQKLLEKSGLTNEEMAEFLELNGLIVEQAPQTAEAISEQGNAYAAVLEEVQKLNDAEKARLIDETSLRLSEEMQRQESILRQQKAAQEAIAELEQERTGALENVSNWTNTILGIDGQINSLQQQRKSATGDELAQIDQKLIQLHRERDVAEVNLGQHERTIEKLDKQIEKQGKKLENANKELELYDQLVGEYEALILAEAGINAERGEGLTKLREQRSTIEEKRRKLEEENRTGKIGNEIYAERSRDLDTQKRKIDEAIGKLERMNQVAQEPIYKDLNVKTNPTISALNTQLAAPLTRSVYVGVHGPGVNVPRRLAYKDGTDFHPGGEFIAGEEGPELARIGNRWSLLDFGLYSAPAGMQVFTHNETKKILDKLNRTPGYATGVGVDATARRAIEQLNTVSTTDQETGQPSVINITVVSELDGREVGRGTYRYVSEFQQRDERRTRRFETKR